MKSDLIFEKIRQKLKESDPQNRTLSKVFQWNFNDDFGKPIKSVVMDLKELKIYDGNLAKSDVEINITDDDFYQVGIKQISLQVLVESGKVNIKGDPDAFYKMIEKFKLNANK